MALSRREFLKIMGGTVTAALFSSVLFQGCKKVLRTLSQKTNVIWLRGLSCGGCSLSLLNSIDPDILTLVTQSIDLDYHQMLMAGSGDAAGEILDDALNSKNKDYILVVEGALPSVSGTMSTLGNKNGKPVSVADWVKRIAEKSYTADNLRGVIAVGTCASFGGMAASKNTSSGAMSVRKIVRPGIPVINVSGCPPHPDWIVGTLLHLMVHGTIDVDEYDRPLLYYGKTVHTYCSRLYDYKRGKFAKNWSDQGCLYNLGCLGIDSGCDITKRKWLGGAGSCTDCGSGCIGCTEMEFPDYGKRGLFEKKKAFRKYSAV